MADADGGGRKVTFGVASSLDGFIARPDHAVDWLLWSDEVSEITAEFWKTVDTVVMGRKTYEVLVAQIDLELIETKVLKTGCVYVLYRVKR